jgi:hypothetical protein
MPKVDSPGQSGLKESPLGSNETAMLEMFFERGLEDVRELDTEVILHKMQEYREEIAQTARVAKATFNKNFDGFQPQSGAFGVSPIRAGYFGYDSWDNCPDATEGEVTTWFDDAQPDNLNGSGGVNNPLSVGEPIVHVILGVGSYAQSPKAEALRFRLNDQPRTSIELERNFRNTDLRMQFLDTPILLKDDDDVFAEYYASATGNEALYPIGLSFIEAKDYREIDPANMAGTDQSNIVVE